MTFNFTTLRFIVLVALVSACSKPASYERLPDGILLRLDKANAKLLKVRVVSDDIIHVSASPTGSFSSDESLMVVPDAGSPTDWKLIETKTDLTLTTKALHAKIVRATGEIIFTDTAGNVLLQEQKSGKEFTPRKVDNLQAYTIRQVFESPDDEAFYGLGSHQNGQMNYKGEDVELVQHNIVAVVPFLYSSKNYGILWDNYSISKFGDPRDYQPLSSLKLFTRDGKEGGLTATYYNGDKIFKEAVEDKIDYEYLETPQVDNFPQEVARNGKVLWEGSFTSDVEGAHKFVVYASGYFKVWVDQTLIMDKWRQGWNPWTNKFTVDVKPGERHDIKIEWIPDGGAYLAVKHLDPLPEVEQRKLSLWSEVGHEINYYFIKGNNADEVISGYRKLTGKAPIVPKWALGFWQSRERYNDEKELVDVVKEYRKRQIPLDNIVLDWRYWEDPKWGSHEFDNTRFPDPKGMIGKLHQELNANIMISVWPKFNKGTEHFEEMKEKGFLFIKNVQPTRKDWVGEGYESTFYDPFNPEAGKLFWKQIDEKLNKLGIDAWWLDATEPDIHSNLSIEARKENMNPTALGPGEKYFNAYSLVNSKSVFEGQRKSTPDKRVFILTRSAYAGQQRYGAVTWTGDVVSRWSDFQDQIAAGINFSLSGIPYWTMDIGGFSVEKRFEKAFQSLKSSSPLERGPGGEVEVLNEWRELNTRWFQFGAFCPIFRSHGQYPYREIYNIAPQGTKAYESMVFYTKLRYRLMPYIYSLAGHTYLQDYTIMRGLVMDFNDDPNVHAIGDQYMLGPSLLVNPVYEYKARSRSVYLPRSNSGSEAGWYDFYTGEYFKGGRSITAEAPLERIPLYVKEGSILPVGPALQYVDEKPASTIVLYVFTGRDATFSLYEDGGVNYDYEKGAYATIPIRYDEQSKTLTIGEYNGTFKDLLEERVFQIVWVKADRPVGVSFNVRPDQEVSYKGREVSVVRE